MKSAAKIEIAKSWNGRDELKIKIPKHSLNYVQVLDIIEHLKNEAEKIRPGADAA